MLWTSERKLLNNCQQLPPLYSVSRQSLQRAIQVALFEYDGLRDPFIEAGDVILGNATAISSAKY